MLTTLPWDWYTDPETLRREQQRIFRSAWAYAGHLGRLSEPGSFFTTTVGMTPIVVTRGRDGELGAFLNICRHRGFPVAQGEGRDVGDAPSQFEVAVGEPGRLGRRQDHQRSEAVGFPSQRSDEHLATTLAYIEENPVKAGLCAKAVDWQFSSAWNGWGGRDARGPSRR